MNEKQKGFSSILVIGLVVLVLVGVGGAGYYFLNKKNINNQSHDQQNSINNSNQTVRVDNSPTTTDIKFLFPTAGDKLFIDSTYNIKWIANGSDNIKVLEILSGNFSDDGAGYNPSFIGKGYPVVSLSEGSYQITIPESPLFPLEDGYRVYIRTDNAEAYSDVFNIVNLSE